MAGNGIMPAPPVTAPSAVTRRYDDTTQLLAPPAPGTKNHEALEEHEDNWLR
jgi:hypothetical protein